MPRLTARRVAPYAAVRLRLARRCWPKPMRQFEARTGHRILERYGMTETNMNTSNPYDGERRAGTVGFALPGVEVRITDPAPARKCRRARSA